MNIPRYSPNPIWWWMSIMDDKDGKFCEYRDYVKLEAEMKLEMEILRAEVEFWKSATTDNGIACNERANENQGLENEIARLKTELTDLKSTADRFKAEVESLMTNPTSRLLRAEREENARLKAEVERLRIAGSESEPRFVFLSDYQHLRTRVERLTKAGDELHAFLIDYIVESRISSAYLNKLDDNWNAAKEGKQS